MIVPAHLAHLPRAGTLPAPTVAARGMPARLRVAVDPALRDPGVASALALYEVEAPDAQPVLGQMGIARQRRAILDGRCQVCDVRLPPCTPRWVVPHGRVDGLVDEPWACPACLAFALVTCPFLLGVRRRLGPDTPLLHLHGWQYHAVLVDLASVHGGREGHQIVEGPREGTAVGMVRLKPLQSVLYTVEAFSRWARCRAPEAAEILASRSS